MFETIVKQWTAVFFFTARPPCVRAHTKIFNASTNWYLLTWIFMLRLLLLLLLSFFFFFLLLGCRCSRCQPTKLLHRLFSLSSVTTKFRELTIGYGLELHELSYTPDLRSIVVVVFCLCNVYMFVWMRTIFPLIGNVDNFLVGLMINWQTTSAALCTTTTRIRYCQCQATVRLDVPRDTFKCQSNHADYAHIIHYEIKSTTTTTQQSH